ncbi:myotubularin-related protein DDB_G0290005 isoform X3 [Hermetia illucens]|nr:myotubularin-related protein DDB_G0290005 isoform X3 [Hermetia illucens]
MPFGRKSPLEALALPGVILAYKYSQFRQRRREAANRRVTERELSALHHKIDKLLSKLEESEPEPPTSQEDECVICINARATMQTSPCGHRVVCRRCFVKTIQSAVAQRLLPLRCVICRARVNRLTSTSGSWRIQESASSYSMGARSWASAPGVPQSASSYSMGDNNHHHHLHHPHIHHNGHHHHRVAQSSSLYSMSSGSSSFSGTSNNTSCSATSSISTGAESTSTGSTSSSSASSSAHHPHHLLNNKSHHHPTCANGCLGAIPRKPILMNGSTTNTYPGRRYGKGRIADLQNRLPPIKEFKSPAKVPTPSPVHFGNPRLRSYASYTKPSGSQEATPLLKDPSPSRPAHSKSNSAPVKSQSSSSSKTAGLTSKVGPLNSKLPIQKNGLTTMEKLASNSITKSPDRDFPSYSHHHHPSSSKTFPLISSKLLGSSLISGSSSAASRNHHSHHQDEKADNKKNESMEKRKKEEKLKLKAEKEARKEEKRIAKEEERLAKQLAKEEKKKGKREAKELLLANDGNKK